VIGKALLLQAAVAAAAGAGELLLGRGETKITPPPGMPMGGGFTIRLGTGVHDDLYCKAVLFQLDGAKAALVSCDVESLHRPLVLKARRMISAAGRIDGDRVMLTATHSHSGPEMTPFVLDDATGEAARTAKAYHDALPGKIAEAVALADANKTAARVWFAKGEERTVSFNRRYLMKNGSVQTNPGQRNPDIVRPAGPIDPEVIVVYFDSPQGKPLATIVNFALHHLVGRPGLLIRLSGRPGNPARRSEGPIDDVDVSTRMFGEHQSGGRSNRREAERAGRDKPNRDDSRGESPQTLPAPGTRGGARWRTPRSESASARLYGGRSCRGDRTVGIVAQERDGRAEIPRHRSCVSRAQRDGDSRRQADSD
jgi:hypothetical protein